MARLHQLGFELNSVSVDAFAITGAPTIDTVTFKSGAYSLLVNTSGKLAQVRFLAANTVGPFYLRFYIYVNSIPSSDAVMVYATALTNGSAPFLKLMSTGALGLFNNTTKIGSSSAVLTLSQWYLVEAKFDNSPAGGSQVLEAKLNGTIFATASNLTIAVGSIREFTIGADNFVFSANFDDIAVNDSSGSNQTSYQGAGGIVHLLPDSAGDNTQWTPLASTNFSQVQEVTPDDATSYVSDNTTSHIDDYNLAATPAAIGVSDTINTVAVGVRFAGVSTSANASIVVRIKAASGGTVTESSAIAPNASTYKTNTNASPFNYPIMSYTKPGGAVAWTKADLDTAQIGVRTSASSTNATRVSTIWMSVDSTPGVGGATTPVDFRSLLGVGI